MAYLARLMGMGSAAQTLSAVEPDLPETLLTADLEGILEPVPLLGT